MKFNIGIFLLCGIISRSSIAAGDGKLLCGQHLEGYESCRISDLLVLVRELNPGWEQVQSLIISDQQIVAIAKNAFENLQITDLKLQLANTRLDLERYSFHGLPMLKSLEFISGIVTLQSDLFQEVQTIRNLALIIKGSQVLSKDQVPRIRDLRNLTISHSSLTRINRETFFNIYTNIENLTLSHNNIKVIEPWTFFSLKNLKNLNLISNNLTTENFLPGIFLGLQNLKNLRVKSDILNSIRKDMFRGLDKLVRLDLSENEINAIEIDAFFGMQISSLRLNDNFLRKLKRGMFRGLKELRTLNLRGNIIDGIESGTFDGLNLIKLNLMSNLIIRIESPYFQGLVTEKLLLSENSITHIQDNAFKDLGIQSLHIDDNRLTYVRSTFFHWLKDLKILNLRENQISRIEEGTFSSLNLTTLDLSYNPLNELQEESFNGLICKEIIFLNSTIMKLNHDVLKNLIKSMTGKGSISID